MLPNGGVMERFLIIASVAGALLAFTAGAAPQAGGEVALRVAIEKEMVKGDLKGAIDQYKKLAQGKDRAVAAKALLQMGRCYEKLGDAEAARAYERIVREFGDQKEAAAEARKYLESKGAQADNGIVTRQIQKVGDRLYGAISSDGRYGAFTYQSGRVGLHDLVTGEQKNLVVRKTPDESLNRAMVSPDGKSVAYTRGFAGGAETWLVNADGSNPRRLAGDETLGVRAVAWSPDGRQLLAAVNYKQSQSSKPPEHGLLAVPDGSFTAIGPGQMAIGSFSPDGSQIAFVRFNSAAQDSTIYLQSVKGGAEIAAVENAGGADYPLWTPDGQRLLFVRNNGSGGDLWALRILDGKPSGPIEFVRNGIGGLIGVSRDGEYFYRTALRARDVYVSGLDPQTGKLTTPSRRISKSLFNGGAAFSPDGQWIAYYAWPNASRDSDRHVVVRPAGGGQEMDVAWKAPSGPVSGSVQWFPDSRSIFVYSFDGKVGQIDAKTGDYHVLADDVKIPQYQYGHPGGYPEFDTDVLLAPDGRSVYYFASTDGPRQTRLVRLDLQDKSERELSRFEGTGSEIVISPDRSQLAFKSVRRASDGKNQESFVSVPAGGGEPKELCKCEFGQFLGWSKDGQRLFFTKWGEGHIEMYAVPVGGGTPEALGNYAEPRTALLQPSPQRHADRLFRRAVERPPLGDEEPVPG